MPYRARALRLGSYLVLILVSGSGWAEGAFDANSINSSQVKPSALDCGSFCSLLVDPVSKQYRGLDGTPGWKGQTDDQWCADHGAPTQASVVANPAPTPLPRAPSCNVALLVGDTSCQDTNVRLAHCKFHNSQVESQCMAYETARKAGGGEKVVLAMDVAAAATCGTACASQGIPFGAQALIAACQIAGASAGAAELIQTLTAKSSGIAKVIGAASGAIGVGMSAKSIVSDGLGGNMTYTGPQSGAVLTKQGFGGWKDANGNPVHFSNDKNGVRKSVCIAAITFGAMTGVRAVSMKQQNDTQKNACSSVQQLVSQATNGANMNVFGAGSYLSSNSAASANPGLGGPVSGNAVSAAQSLKCVASQGMTSGGCGDSVGTLAQSAAATDGGLLRDSGLGNAVAPLAANLNPDGLAQRLADGTSAGDLISGAMGSNGSSPTGRAVAALAQGAERAAIDLGAQNLPSSAYSGGGAPVPASGSAKSGGGDATGLLASLMGGGQKDANGNSATDMKFRSAAEGPEGSDIWHRGASGTIFKIVSDKITRARDRVDQLDWSSPMNRALSGSR